MGWRCGAAPDPPRNAQGLGAASEPPRNAQVMNAVEKAQRVERAARSEGRAGRGSEETVKGSDCGGNPADQRLN